jgi:hypothetical protein
MKNLPQPPQGPLPPQGQPPLPGAPVVPPQGQGAPAPVPLLQPPPGAPTATRNYLAYYNDPANDPFSGRYAGIMNTYAVPLVAAANPLTPQILAQRTYQSAAQGTPISFLILTSPANAAPGLRGQLILLHRVSKLYVVVGMPVHQWSDRAFAFKGDLVHSQLPLQSISTPPTFIR